MIKILKDTSIYALGDALTKGLGFIAIIFYAHFISQSDMGAYGYILIIIGFANTFLILGADNAYARYFFEYKNEYQRKVLTTTIFVFLFIWIIVVLFLPILYYKEISSLLLHTSKYALAFLFAFVSLPLKLIASMSNQALRNQFQTKKFVFFNFITTFVTVVSAILLLHFTNLGIAAIFLGMIVGDLVVIPLRFVDIKELFVKKVDFTILKKILSYGIPFVPASVAYWIFSSADRVMLESLSGLESVGIYTVATSLSSVISLVANAIGQAWSPQAIKVYEEDKEKAKKLYIKFLYTLIAIVLFLIFCASLFGKEIISMIFPSEYLRAFYPMLLLFAGIGFQITSQVTAIGISIAKKTVYFVYVTLFIAIINILLNYFLIPIYTEIGASFATMISYLLLTIFYGTISQKFFRLDYDFKFIVLSVLTLVIIYFFSFLSFSIKIVIFFLAMVFLYYNIDKIKKEFV